MKTITKRKLLKAGCCSESVNRYFPNETKRRQVDDILKEVIRTKNYLDGALALSLLMTQKQRVAWAIYSAEQVLHIFEDKYPNDDRPRKAIEAAKAWLKHPSDAADAANAAHAAAYAANAANAANAADDAAHDAVRAAANAAHAAAYAANAANAANAAANAAAYADAAYAAVHAAAVRVATNAAAYAARAAAVRAAADAAKDKMYKKLLLRGLQIVRGGA